MSTTTQQFSEFLTLGLGLIPRILLLYQIVAVTRSLTITAKILSHCWSRNAKEEANYHDFKSGRAKRGPGYGYWKISDFCKLARKRGYRYGWVDTCCINKESSAELSEAINSMFTWYKKADECLVYLEDVEKTPNFIEDLRRSKWFTRGWTLQELLAPSKVVFLSRDWRWLGTKETLRDDLSAITGIPPEVLDGTKSPQECSIAQRMSWASGRTTSRSEDRAYSLLGLFDVSLPMLYGEGAKAFLKLQEEIVRRSDDSSIFAWMRESDRQISYSGQEHHMSILAPSPNCFRTMGRTVDFYPGQSNSLAHSLANSWLSIRLTLIPWSMGVYLAPLFCGETYRTADLAAEPSYDRVCIFIKQIKYDNHYIRVPSLGADTQRISRDHLALMQRHFDLQPKQCWIEHSAHAPPKEIFYWLQFDFSQSRIFENGNVPSQTEFTCVHLSRAKKFTFELAPGLMRSVLGVFSTCSHFVYFGFNPDFAPICLITTRTRIPPAAQPFRYKLRDLTSLEEHEKEILLDLRWVLHHFEEGRAELTGSETFAAHRRDGGTFTSSALGITMKFWLADSPDESPSVSQVRIEQPKPGHPFSYPVGRPTGSVVRSLDKTRNPLLTLSKTDPVLLHRRHVNAPP